MGQQPNIELEISDLPRPTAHPAAARSWSPGRPGDLAGPGDLPSGRSFGSTGPDPGYALRLVRSRDLETAPAEKAHNAQAAVAALAGARAARFGRAPTIEDVDLGAIVLGYDTAGIGEDLIAGIAADRLRLVANLSHSARRKAALVALVPEEVLLSSPQAVRSRMAAGERLLGS